MSGLEELMNDVKSVIRGLVISSPTKVSICQLESEYRKQEGCNIPYRNLGYTSLESFLYAITDTVYLRESFRGCSTNKMIVEPIQSEKSSHIEKMVMNQITRTEKNKKTASAQPGYEKKKSSTSVRFLPVGLRVALYNVFNKYNQRELPLATMCEEMYKYMHIVDGWSKEDPSFWLKAHGFDDMSELVDIFVYQNLIKVTVRDGTQCVIPNFQKGMPEINIPRTSEIVKVVKQDKSSRCNNYGAESYAPDRYSNVAGQSVMPTRDESHSEETHEDFNPVNAVMSNIILTNLKKVLKKHPEGLWCSNLPRAYKLEAGSELDFRNLGFVSVIEMVSKMKDTFIFTRPDRNSDWLLFDGSSNSNRLTSSLPSCEESNFSPIPRCTLNNVVRLLNASPSGIKKHEILDCYKRKYNEDLPIMDFGFGNITAFLAHLSELGAIKWKQVDGYLVVYGGDESRHEELRKGKYLLKELYPKDIVEIGDPISVQPLPDGMVSLKSMDILVTDVTDPYLFYYQLWRRDVQGNLRIMMSNLQQFYNTHGDDYVMPDGAVQIGQYCAALYPPDTTPSLWHRARITALTSLTEATICYVDYGTSDKVLRSELRFLHQKFTALPIQGLKGRLFNLRPINYGKWKKYGGEKPKWSVRTINVMMALVYNQPLVAVVAKIRERDKFVSVALINTNDDDDKHINDILLELQFAELGEGYNEDYDADDDAGDGVFNSVLEILRQRAIYVEKYQREEANRDLEFEESLETESGNIPKPKTLLELIKLQCSVRRKR